MIEPRWLREHSAELVEVQFSRENQTAQLHFLSPSANNDALVVTIPLQQFRRFHFGIADMLQKDSALFDAPSRKTT